jgi:hypothetical protein
MKQPILTPRKKLSGAYVSASRNRRSENVRVLAIVISELEFCNIERYVFAADLVERADHASLEDRPKALNRVGVNRTDDIFASGVVDDGVGVVVSKVLVADPLVRAEQANLVRDGFMHKGGEGRGADVGDYTSNHVAFAANSARDGRLARANAASAVTAAAIMPVLGFAADESFIDFYNASKLIELLTRERGPYPVSHVPSGFVRAETHVAINLKGAYSLLASEHQVNDAKPIAERLIRVLKDRASNVREAIAALRSALVALPMPRVALQLRGVLSSTARAADTLGPSLTDQIGATGILIREVMLELCNAQLVNGLLGRHGSIPFVRRNMSCPT